MEEKHKKSALAGFAGLAAFFFLGLVVALIIGWWAFPSLMFKEQEQPVAFSHETHIDLVDCDTCHYLREDGTFNGLPSTEQCMECHITPLGETQAEAEFIEKYGTENKPIPWLVHQKQPDNVFFSHAAHSMESCQSIGCHAEWTQPEDLCIACHPSVADLDQPVPYQENRLTGYSRSTMKMADCESCHANPNHNASNACFTCHK